MVFIVRSVCRAFLRANDQPIAGSSGLPQLLHRAGISKMNEMQTQAIREIQSGSHLLIVAPTGSGKTEAALFPVLESLGSGDRGGVRALYVTPLRALNRNMIDRVLRLVASTKLTAAGRHGDTPTPERREPVSNAPD